MGGKAWYVPGRPLVYWPWLAALRRNHGRGGKDNFLGRKLTLLEAVAGAALFFGVTSQVARSVVGDNLHHNSGFVLLQSGRQ